MSRLRETVLARLCARQVEIVIIFALSVIALVVTVLSILYVDLNPSTRVVAYLNVPGLIFMITWTGGVLYLCRDDISYGRGE